tara:strand:- start:1014 stop:2183 length:1170 start_codon:yes stop_codon:yes gene_type:complete
MKTFPTGKLADFFRFYDPSNKQHVAGVLRLQADLEEIAPNLICDQAEWVKLYRTPLKQQQVTSKVDNSWGGIATAARNAGAKFPELLAAQWALESGFGKYPSGKWNYWGIKGGGRRPETTCTRKETSEFINGEWITTCAWFKNFSSIEDGANYVVTRWYKDFESHKGVNRAESRDQAAHLLVKEGYATDPKYAEKLIDLMDQYSQSASVQDGGNVELKVPYLSQIDSDTDQGFRMCFSSSCAMALDYLCPGVLQGHKDDFYLSKVNEVGDTTDPYAQRYALESFGLDVDFRQDLTLSDIKAQLTKGIPVPIGVLHQGPSSSPAGGGHWVIVVGFDEDGLIVNDPYGEMDVINGGYINHTNGDHIRYSYQNLLPRWCVEGEGSGWGMIIA